MADAPTTPEEMKLFKPTAPLAAYARIFDLGPERVAALNNYLLTESHTYEQIMLILRTEWKVFAEVKDDALRRQLVRYKNDFILPKQAEIAAKLTQNQHVQKLVRVASQLQASVDVLKEMEWAVQVQLRRVRKLKKLEKVNKNSIYKEMDDNLYLLMHQLTQLGKLQMDVGILKKVPKKIQLSGELTEEEMHFVEKAKLHAEEQTMTAEAVRYLRQHKLLTASEQTLQMVPVQSAAEPAMAQTTSTDGANDIVLEEPQPPPIPRDCEEP
jgi:hypothetical protein